MLSPMKTSPRLALAAATALATLATLGAGATTSTAAPAPSSPAASGSTLDVADSGQRRAATPWGVEQNDTLTGGSRSYTFTVTEAALARFVLGNLPTNYDLALTDPSGKQIKKSRKNRDAYEQILARVKPGDYTLTVTARDTVSPEPYTLVGQVYTEPTVLNRTLNTYNLDGTFQYAQYVVEFINPTKKTLYFSAGLDVYDEQGGFTQQEPIESHLVARPGGVGYAATDHYDDRWWNPGYTVKMVDASVAPATCENPWAAPTKKIKWAQVEDSEEWVLTGLVKNPRKEGEHLIDGLWAARDAMGVPREIDSYNLNRVEAGRTSSIDSFGNVYRFDNDVPHSWTLQGYIRYACDF